MEAPEPRASGLYASRPPGRRGLLLAGCGLAAGLWPAGARSAPTSPVSAASASAAAADETARAAIARLERRLGGRLGVFALEDGRERRLAHRADERFLMQSTFKAPLAAMVLWRVDRGEDRLDAAVSYSAADLRPHSPLTRANLARASLARGAMSVAGLCEAILTQSDNAAANLLLARVGGPAALTRFIRGLGDPVTRVDRFELVGGWSGEQDTTTPRAMAGLVRAALLGDVLGPESRGRLRAWMGANLAGRDRLRAGLPAGWNVADRTGTGDGVCNDCAVAWPPGGPPLVITAFAESLHLPPARQDALLAAVGRVVAAWRAST